MKRINISILFPLLTIFLFACTTSKDPVVGTWKCSKIIKTEESPDASGKTVTLIDESAVLAGEKKPATAKDANINNLLASHPEINKTIKFKADKSVVMTSNISKQVGRWSMNPEGNAIVITLDGSQKVLRIKFSDPTVRAFSFHEKLKYGEYDIHYLKSK